TEGLRAFAQRRALVGEVVAVPSPIAPEQDRLVVVEGGTGPVTEGMEYVESTEAELRRVTDLVIEHARGRPERSLAVLTFTEEHARRLMERIMNTVSVIPALRGFFDPDSREVFTVMPAAQASSLIRDDIIVSIGFGKTPHGRLLHRFGPLSEAGGRKALATVITRARGRTTVVSSLDVEDLDPSRLRTDGAHDPRASARRPPPPVGHGQRGAGRRGDGAGSPGGGRGGAVRRSARRRDRSGPGPQVGRERRLLGAGLRAHRLRELAGVLGQP